MQTNPSQLLQTALISGGFTLLGLLLAAVVAGIYKLRATGDDYVNDYYKTVINRRIEAYEQLERLIESLRTAVVDQDCRPYHFVFDQKEALPNLFKEIFDTMSHGLWLSDEAFAKTRDLNYLVFRMSVAGGDMIEVAKQNHPMIAEGRESLERILAADMLGLHDVKRFLKRKKNSRSGFQPVQLYPSRGPSGCDVTQS